MDDIDPDSLLIKRILHRDQCIQKNGICFKDLTAIKNIDLGRTILIDNLILSFAPQPENGIYIPSYYGSEKDNELDKILKFLLKIVNVVDVRPFLSKFSEMPNYFEKMQ